MSQTDTGVSGASEMLITRACDMCRKKKIRCEPTSDICVQCRKYKTYCRFTPIKVKRKPRRPNGQPRVDELEKRLKRMEEQLRLAAQNQSQSSTEGESSPESMEIVRQESPPIEYNARPWLPYGQSDFLRPPKATDTQNLVVLSLTDGFAGLQENYTRGEWNLTPRHSFFTRRIFKPLPPKDEALRLIRRGLESFNSAFPIFSQQSCLKMMEYSQDFNDPSWWACVNVVLALGHRFDALRSEDNITEDRKAWGYFQNALSVSTELSMLHADLGAIQALLGMAIIVQGTPNTNPFSALLSSAVKLAHVMGLHLRKQPSGLSLAEIETRKQVFWVAYFLDKEHSLRTGQPPNQDDDEMDVGLPFQYPERAGLHGSQDSRSFFLARIDLAKIQGQVYKRLMSVRASRQSTYEKSIAVRELLVSLKRWKSMVPIDFDEEYFLPTPQRPGVTPMMHAVTIRLSYFKTLSTIHHLISTAQDKPGSAEPGEDQHQIHELPPPITCVEEARKAIKLLHLTPREDYGCIWVVLHIFVSATTTLLNHVVSDPTSPLATSDLTLIEPLLRLLGALAKQGKSEEVSTMYTGCNELWEQATRLVWMGGSERDVEDCLNLGGGVGVGLDDVLEKTPRVNESGGEKESIEDFIRRIEVISQGGDAEGVGVFSNFDMFSV